MIIFREKLVNTSTGDVRQGNILLSKLGDDIEQITIDSVLTSVKYYYVKTPDGEWRKTQYYELIDDLHTITFRVNDTVYQTDYYLEGDTITAPVYTPLTGYDWSGWINAVPETMPASNVVIDSTSELINYSIVYYIDNNVVYTENHHYNDSITEYVPLSRKYYTFSGWTGFPQSGLMPAENVTVTGTYVENESYTLTYYVDASVYHQDRYKEGQSIYVPDDPEVEEGYEWSGWVDLPSLMPGYDSSVNSSIIGIKSYTVNWLIENEIVYSELLRYGSNITAPDIYIEQRQGFIFAWDITESTVPGHDVSVYGYYTVIKEYNTVYWYLDSSLYYSNEYRYNTTVTSPVSSDYEHIYVWDEDSFVMPPYDKTINGYTINREITEDFTGVPFGIAVYNHRIGGGYPEKWRTGSPLNGDIPDWCYVPLMRGEITGTTSIDLYDNNDNKLASIQPTIRLQYSDNSTVWYDIQNYTVDFNSEENNFNISSGVMQDRDDPLVNCKFMRLYIADFGDVSGINSSIINNTAYFKVEQFMTNICDNIRTYAYYYDGEEIIPAEGSIVANSYLDIYDTLLVFGEYDTFYSHLLKQLNDQFGTNIGIRGIILNVGYMNNTQHGSTFGVEYSHNAIERDAYNRINSVFSYIGQGGVYGPWILSSLRSTPQCKATNLYPECYRGRWSGQLRLSYISALTSTTLAEGCYREMFKDCNILSVPSLSATTLAKDCYRDMFNGCVELTSSPSLSASTLAEGCYYGMFKDCTSIRNAGYLSGRIVPKNAFRDMFNGCTSLIQIAGLSGQYFGEDSCNSMFKNCQSLQRKPVYTAVDASVGYDTDMYYGCTSLEN